MNVNINSAQRLFNILTKIKKTPNSQVSKESWKKVFNMTSNDDPLLLTRIGKLMQLQQDVLRDVKKYCPKQFSNQKYWVDPLSRAFSTLNLTADFSLFVRHLDPHTFSYLSITAELLDERMNSAPINQKIIDDFRGQIQSILLEILSSNINEDIKKYLNTRLKEIISALDEHSITGITPVVEKLESVLGHAIYDTDYRNTMSNTPVGKKIFSVINAFVVVITLVNEVPKLPNTIDKAVKLIEKVIDVEIVDNEANNKIDDIMNGNKKGKIEEEENV